MTEQAIERRTMPDVVLGGGDMAELVEQTRRNVEAAIQFARERKFVTEYPVDGGTRLFFHHPTWQLLGQSFGLTAYTEGEPVEVKPGTWRAAAVAARVDTGMVVGRAIGLCAKSEPGKRNPTDHDIAAKAQTRAQRNALRSALGAIIVAAGFEIADPGAPATTEQVGLLHKLARDVYGSEGEAKAQLEVPHFRDLTREQAADLIETLDQRLSKTGNPHSTPVVATQLAIDTARAEGISLEEAAERIKNDLKPPPDGEAGEERPDKRMGEGEGPETEAGIGSGSPGTPSPAGRKRSAAKQGSSSPPDRAAAGPEPGGPADPALPLRDGPGSGPPSQDHMHDWQPAPTQAMAAKGWQVCSICRKALGPGEAG